MKRTIVVLVLSCAGFVLHGFAGDRTSIQGLGMARAYTAVARGLDAAGINPAGVDGDSATITFGLLPFGAHFGSDFLSYGLYTRYFTGVESDNGRVGRYLSDADKRDILAAFPGGVGSAGLDAEARLVGLALHLGPGTIAVTVTEKASAAVKIPQDYASFLFYGNAPGSVYDFKESSMAAWWIREYALSLATTWHDAFGLKSFSAGASVKIIHGFGYAEVDRFNSRLETGTNGVLHGVIDMHSRSAGSDLLAGSGTGGFDPFPAPAGSGLGFDLGVAADLNSMIRIGVSVTDIGSVEWNRNVREAWTDSSFSIDNPLDEAQRDGIQNALRGKNVPAESFATSLPTTVRVGVDVELTQNRMLRKIIFGDMTVACDVAQVLAPAPGIVAGTRFSLGMEWRLFGFLPLRTGYMWGGTDHQNFALGLGLHLGFFQLDLASENMGWLLDRNTFSYASVSAGMKLRF